MDEHTTLRIHGSNTRRLLFHQANMDEKKDYETWPGEQVPVRDSWTWDPPPVSSVIPNAVSSETISGKHAPAIDLDIPHQYVPSTNAGHGLSVYRC